MRVLPLLSLFLLLNFFPCYQIPCQHYSSTWQSWKQATNSGHIFFPVLCSAYEVIVASSFLGFWQFALLTSYAAFSSVKNLARSPFHFLSLFFNLPLLFFFSLMLHPHLLWLELQIRKSSLFWLPSPWPNNNHVWQPLNRLTWRTQNKRITSKEKAQ